MIYLVVGSTWKDFDDKSNWGISVCTSGARPTAYDGRAIYETDTDKFLIYDGAAWEEISGAGDFKADGSVSMTGDLTFNKTDAGIRFATGDYIWFDTSENRIYFEINSDNICYVYSTGLFPDNDDTYYLGSGSSYWKALYASSIVMETGTYIKDVSSNMELHVATGKAVKIVVG